MIASFKRSLWVGGIAVIAFGAIMALMATSMSIAHADDPKPGTLQPVWCHLTGHDWKAQLGALPSGQRNEAFPLMGDFGQGTLPSGQTQMHDRSNKLDGECASQVPSKAPVTTHGQWVDGQGDCTKLTVTQTRTKTVTTYTYHIVDTAWVETATPVTTTETQTRPMTITELQACVTKPNPQPLVVYGDWEDGAKNCTNETVAQTRTVTTTTYAVTWQNDAWVVTPNTPVVTTEQSHRDMTAEESAACNEQPSEPGVATATFNILPAYCDASQVLKYGKIENATVENGSTVDGAMGPSSYTVTVTADDGFLFAANAEGVSLDRKTVIVSGQLADHLPLTSERCIQGADTTTPGTTGGGSGATTTPAVAQLPETDGEATAVIAVGGSLLAVVAGFAGIRRFLTRGL